jgi:hypothetical protein
VAGTRNQLQWKINQYHIFLCVRALECGRECGCVRICPSKWAPVCACACVALLVQLATRMRHIMLSFLFSSLAPPYVSTFSHKRHDFRKNVTAHQIRALIFSTNLSETFLILQIIVINVKTPSCKARVILIGFQWNLDFLDRLSNEKTQHQISSNPIQWGRVTPWKQTDRHDEANSSFYAILRTHLKEFPNSIAASVLDMTFLQSSRIEIFPPL